MLGSVYRCAGSCCSWAWDGCSFADASCARQSHCDCVSQRRLVQAPLDPGRGRAARLQQEARLSGSYGSAGSRPRTTPATGPRTPTSRGQTLSYSPSRGRSGASATSSASPPRSSPAGRPVVRCPRLRVGLVRATYQGLRRTQNLGCLIPLSLVTRSRVSLLLGSRLAVYSA